MQVFSALSKITESGLAWFILGVILLLIELSAPGILAIFFAAGAWITAIVLWIGLIHGSWGPLAIFLVTSLLFLILLRRRLQAVVRGKVGTSSNTDAILEDFEGKAATVVEPIDPLHQTGKVEFRGTLWAAKSETPVPAGTLVEILSRDNLILNVKPKKE